MENFKFEELKIGQTAEITLSVNDQDIDQFAQLSGDYSEVHCSQDFAQKKGFPNRIGHGMLAGAYASQLIGMKLPGKRGVLQSMDLKFRKPFFPGDVLRVMGEIQDMIESVRVVKIKIKILNQNDDVVCSGIAQSGVGDE